MTDDTTQPRQLLPVLRQDGVTINTTELMTGDITIWTPEGTLAGHGILRFLGEKIEARLKKIKTALADLADNRGAANEKGNMILKLGGGTIRHEFRRTPKPVEPLIAKWCRENGLYDVVFPRTPTFQPDQLTALRKAGKVPDDVWATFYTENVVPAVVVKDDPELVSFLEALTSQAPQLEDHEQG